MWSGQNKTSFIFTSDFFRNEGPITLNPSLLTFPSHFPSSFDTTLLSPYTFLLFLSLYLFCLSLHRIPDLFTLRFPWTPNEFWSIGPPYQRRLGTPSVSRLPRWLLDLTTPLTELGTDAVCYGSAVLRFTLLSTPRGTHSPFPDFILVPFRSQSEWRPRNYLRPLPLRYICFT